ncbi:hypothetical protein CI1B_72900 [Bradyrhizobium ivorense]|uniref:Uncharacterized protein n=1 Tax=Bradyrhizobium ivorense TaxID=2511166 RepID=A0A508TV50_9BRAD|nr:MULTISPECIES: hypothetical protein [Bradyrhizobium]MCC8937591.1 hypothetical protein [Bradyrhizobium ivorense]QOZ27768.1 hypothetical protein XH93_32270 [Bradyrhizobium sp. CCBAU 51753]VIO78210.1 hypothetical protein CI1B_72900 [Bradyrhizobium ivorense]VIO78652.1 hypothetical protein CI41S_64950 [Bradyrhizobium ivorense]
MCNYLRMQVRNMRPAEIDRIVTAYERTLHALCVRDGDDPLTETIAKSVIKIAKTDIADPAEISAQAIRELRIR